MTSSGADNFAKFVPSNKTYLFMRCYCRKINVYEN